MRVCIFCHNAATTHEHYFPKWVLNSTSNRAPYRLTIESQPGREMYGENAKTRQVCKVCNHGWMSNLEISARKVMGPMFHDIALWLDHDAQESIARWTVKTAMIFESLTSPHRRRWFTPGQRRLFREGSWFPAQTLIWLGRYSAKGLSADGKDLRLVIPGVPDVNTGCLAHFLMDHLVIQAVAVVAPEKYSKVPVALEPQPGRWVESLVQIWPPRGTVSWPPRLSFAPDRSPTVTELIDRFSIGV